MRIVTEDERLVRLPFEFVEHPITRDPLLLDPFYTLVRSATGPLVPLEPVKDRPLRILLVGASPHAENLARIDTEAETVLVRGALRPLAQQERVTAQVLLRATPEQLKRALFETPQPFDLVHLTVHADEFGQGEVCFALEGERGLPAFVPVRIVGEWLCHAGVRVAVVAGCDVAATLGLWLARGGMPAAVVMQGAVSDAQTTGFTQDLFTFLANLLPLDAALSLARRLQFERTQGAPDWGAPVFYLQAPSSSLFALESMALARPPEEPEECLGWTAIVALAESDEAAERVRACRELAAFYEREVSTRPGLSQQLTGIAAEAVERLLELACSDPAPEVRSEAQSSFRVLRPPHFSRLFDRLVEQLVSADAMKRLGAEAILKAHRQFERALVASVRSRIHQGNLCFAGRANRVEVRLETDYPGEIRLRCEFGPRFGDGNEATATDQQEVVLVGPRRQNGSLLYSVTPPEPGDFDFWVISSTNGYSAPPVIHPIRCQSLNPYEFGTGLRDPTMFYGRQKDLREIVQAARQQNRIIIGERRIGKTSLLEAVERQLGAPLIPVMLGLPENEKDLFRQIVLEAYTAASLRVSELPLPLALSAPARRVYGYVEARLDMRPIRQRLKRDYESDAQFVLLIDEGDPLFFVFKDKTRTAVRQLMNDLDLTAIISCVRAPEKGEHQSSLVTVFLPLRLKPLTEEETRSLVRDPVVGVLEFGDEAVDFIVKKTQGRPALVQILCYYAVERAHERGQKQIALSDVETVYQEHVLVPDFPLLKDIWLRLSPQVQQQLREAVDAGQLPPEVLQELRNLSVIEAIDSAPRLPVVFADWLREGKRRSWLTPTS